MERAILEGVEIEYEAIGTGEPVLLIHGSVLADGGKPLMSAPALADRYQLIRYHRRGYAGSTHPAEPVSMNEQASDAAGLLRSLGIAAAHVIGHSYGGDAALQLALDAPELVHTLVLEEPALMDVPAAEASLPDLMPMFESYAAGDKAAAIGGFLEWSGGRADYEELLDATLPGALAEAVKDADTLFAVEMPAMPEWQMGREEASAITRPALYILGSKSLPMFGEGCAQLQAWLPSIEVAVAQGVGHFLHIEDPDPVVAPIAAFLAAHPID
jgi:pimeloyl-ACP methyl ester carboxylesterase